MIAKARLRVTMMMWCVLDLRPNDKRALSVGAVNVLEQVGLPVAKSALSRYNSL